MVGVGGGGRCPRGERGGFESLKSQRVVTLFTLIGGRSVKKKSPTQGKGGKPEEKGGPKMRRPNLPNVFTGVPSLARMEKGGGRGFWAHPGRDRLGD